jgi:protein-disulfide isomerase
VARPSRSNSPSTSPRFNEAARVALRAMVTIVLLAAAVDLFGQAPVAQAPAAPRVTIDSAVPDSTNGTLTIAGTNFGTRPFVTLDLVPLNVQLALDQRIIAGVPLDMIPPGTYLLTVTRGSQAGDVASIDITLGGPQKRDSPGSAGASAPAPDISPIPSVNDVAARVGDKTFTVADVDREWQRTDPAGYLSASRQLYDGRRRVLGDLVTSALLAREAEGRGMTVEALLAEELPKRTIPLPDNAVTTLYQSLGDRTRGASLDQMRPALREFLARKVQPDLAKMSYVEELTKVSTRADTMLAGPRLAVTQSADDPVLGPAAAPVQLVVFGDFESPAYAQYAAALPRIHDLFGSRLSIVFKPLPLTSTAAVAAAEAAACANEQGKFWAFHDRLLAEAGALDVVRFKRVASDVGIDRARFDACLGSDAVKSLISADVEEAHRYAIPGSPAFLVNGRLAADPPSFLPPYEYFKRTIEEELAQQSRQAAQPR